MGQTRILHPHNPTTLLECVAEIDSCKIIGLRSSATGASGVSRVRKPLFHKAWVHKCRCRDIEYNNRSLSPLSRCPADRRHSAKKGGNMASEKPQEPRRWARDYVFDILRALGIRYRADEDA